MASNRHIFVPDFVLIPYQLIADRDLEQNDRILYGFIYWYEKMRDGTCTASNQTFAVLLHSTTRAVQNSLNSLEARGYIEREYKDEAKRNRMAIRCKVAFNLERTMGDRRKTSEPRITRERTTGDTRERTTGDQIEKVIEKNSQKETDAAGVEGAGKVPVTAASPLEQQIAEIIFRFRDYNPTYKQLFKRKPQRDAAQRLLELFGFDQLCLMVAFLAKSNASRYAPTITTPVQLENKMGELKAWGDKQRSSPVRAGRKIISSVA